MHQGKCLGAGKVLVVSMYPLRFKGTYIELEQSLWLLCSISVSTPRPHWSLSGVGFIEISLNLS